MRLDFDIPKMTLAELKKSLMRVRIAVRKHRDAQGNARCWCNDLELYEKILPDQKLAGRMDLPETELLRNCRSYIRRQQCNLHSCKRSKCSKNCPNRA